MVIACSPEEEGLQLEGYLLEVAEEQVLLVENISLEEYETIKNLPLNDLVMDYHYPMYYLRYEQAGQFQKGDHVIVTVTGPIAESHPAQGEADKIEKVK